MKRFSEQLHTKAKSVKLQASERNELRERVVSYMEYHPLPKEMREAKSIVSPLQTEAFKMVRIPFAQLLRMSAAAAVLILVIVPVMAERAVPGDGLYAVKVRFNEEVRSTLATTPYEKIEWETERLNRRIAEARLLANEGRLTEEVEAEVAQAVKQHTENAQREIEMLRVEDADEATLATIALNTTLEVQSASFREENEDEEDGEVSPKLLASVIDETLSKQEANNASSTVPGFDKIMARVEMNTTRVHELLASLELNSEDTEYKDITRRIEDIERSVEEAVSAREADDEGARKILIDSMQRTQRLIVFMTELEVSEELDVEEIVPVILTPEEKEAKIQEYTQALNEQVEIIETALTYNDDADLLEKAESSLTSIKEAQEFVATSTDYTAIKVAAEDALALAADTMALLEPQIPDVTASSTDEVVEEDRATSTDEQAAQSEETTDRATTTENNSTDV